MEETVQIVTIWGWLYCIHVTHHTSGRLTIFLYTKEMLTHRLGRERKKLYASRDSEPPNRTDTKSNCTNNWPKWKTKTCVSKSHVPQPSFHCASFVFVQNWFNFLLQRARDRWITRSAVFNQTQKWSSPHPNRRHTNAWTKLHVSFIVDSSWIC